MNTSFNILLLRVPITFKNELELLGSLNELNIPSYMPSFHLMIFEMHTRKTYRRNSKKPRSHS